MQIDKQLICIILCLLTIVGANIMGVFKKGVVAVTAASALYGGYNVCEVLNYRHTVHKLELLAEQPNASRTSQYADLYKQTMSPKAIADYVNDQGQAFEGSGVAVAGMFIVWGIICDRRREVS